MSIEAEPNRDIVGAREGQHCPNVVSSVPLVEFVASLRKKSDTIPIVVVVGVPKNEWTISKARLTPVLIASDGTLRETVLEHEAFYSVDEDDPHFSYFGILGKRNRKSQVVVQTSLSSSAIQKLLSVERDPHLKIDRRFDEEKKIEKRHRIAQKKMQSNG